MKVQKKSTKNGGENIGIPSEKVIKEGEKRRKKKRRKGSYSRKSR